MVYRKIPVISLPAYNPPGYRPIYLGTKLTSSYMPSPPPPDISPPLPDDSTEQGSMLLYYEFLTKKRISINIPVARFEKFFLFRL